MAGERATPDFTSLAHSRRLWRNAPQYLTRRSIRAREDPPANCETSRSPRSASLGFREPRLVQARGSASRRSVAERLPRDDAVRADWRPTNPRMRCVDVGTRPHPDGEQREEATAHWASKATVPQEPQTKEHDDQPPQPSERFVLDQDRQRRSTPDLGFGARNEPSSTASAGSRWARRTSRGHDILGLPPRRCFSPEDAETVRALVARVAGGGVFETADCQKDVRGASAKGVSSPEPGRTAVRDRSAFRDDSGNWFSLAAPSGSGVNRTMSPARIAHVRVSEMTPRTARLVEGTSARACGGRCRPVHDEEIAYAIRRWEVREDDLAAVGRPRGARSTRRDRGRWSAA